MIHKSIQVASYVMQSSNVAKLANRHLPSTTNPKHMATSQSMKDFHKICYLVTYCIYGVMISTIATARKFPKEISYNGVLVYS